MNTSQLLRRGLLPVLACLFVSLSLLVGGSQARIAGEQGDNEELFSAAGSPKDSDRLVEGGTLRARYVTVNAEVLGDRDGSGHGQHGSALTLNLFPDAHYTAVPESVVSQKRGQIVWQGYVEGVDNSSVTITAVGNAVTGSMRVGSQLYKWHKLEDALHLLSEVVPYEPLPEMEPIPVSLPDGFQNFGPESDDGSQIDVLVVYTAASRARYGGQAGIESLINLAIAETNQAYANSEISTQLNLVHAAEVSYTESGNMSTDLSRLRGKADGYMDEIHALRDTYKADMVNLFEESIDFCGIAYLMTTLSNSFEVSAFSVVYSDCATGYYSFGHELGHNMGSHHDRANASGPGVFPYSFGYWNSSASFRTVMSYNCPSGCTRVKHFSNPDVSYNGTPTGIDHQTDPNNSADNARSISEARTTIANWRDSGAAPPQLPAAPSNLLASTTSQSEIDLTWTDNADNENGFVIERSPDGANGWSQVDSVGPNVVAYHDSGLLAGTDYYYRVYAYNSVGNSSPSNTAGATTSNLQPPAAPTNLAAASVSQSEIQLDWVDNADNENGFVIERSPNGSSGWSQIDTVGPNAVAYSDSGLLSGTSYYYRLYSYNGDGNSSYSNVAMARTDNLQPPAAPTNLAATPLLQSTIALLWTDNSNNEDGFAVERSLNAVNGWSETDTVAPNVVNYNDQGLAPATDYYYRVRSFNGDGNSAYSDVVLARTDDPPQIYDLVALTDIFVAGSVSGDCTATWVDDGELEMITERESGGKPSTRHTFMEHKWSFDLLAGQATTFWANVWATSSADDDQFVFSYSMDDVTYRDLFTVGETSDNGMYMVSQMPDTSSGTLYVKVTDTDRTPGHRFRDTIYIDHIFVRTEMTLGAAPEAPESLSADPISGSQISLSWQDMAANEYGYEIERKLASSSWSLIGAVGADSESYADTGLMPLSTYSYRIRAFNGAGYSAYTSPVSATTFEVDTLHLGQLTGTGEPASRNHWDATVPITVHDQNHNGVAGVTISGNWNALSGADSASCTTTDSSGICTITKFDIKRNVSGVTFSVTDVSHGDYIYVEIANDVGLTVTINQPQTSGSILDLR
jgi:hypothetical protein